MHKRDDKVAGNSRRSLIMPKVRRDLDPLKKIASDLDSFFRKRSGHALRESELKLANKVLERRLRPRVIEGAEHVLQVGETPHHPIELRLIQDGIILPLLLLIEGLGAVPGGRQDFIFVLG
jgi:hypothetical protein